MERWETAVAFKHGGLNCCQAVLAAFADRCGLDTEQLKALGAGFGVGMGCFEATCGALCAVQMILGLERYAGKPILKDAKTLFKSFEARAGATQCAALKGITTGQVLCPCDDCVRYAVQCLEEVLG